MRSIIRIAAVLVASFALSACVVTAPVKVATTGAKVGYKTAKAGTKGVIKAGSLIIPESDTEKEEPTKKKRRR